MKHIESIQPEYAASDLSRLLVSEPDATASAALTALLHNVTGCAIPPTADTPQSEVEELVPLCLSILRRHWQTSLTALGDGTTPMSLADLLRRLIGDRVQGNEAWSIPAIHADIPTAVAALRQRDMFSGLTLTLTDGTIMPLPDGLSLAQLLCGVSPDGSDLASSVTELQDSNKGWTMTKPFGNTIFPNAEIIEIGCGSNTTYVFTEHPIVKKIVFTHQQHSDKPFFQCTTSYTGNFASLTDVEFPELIDCCELLNKGSQSGWYNIGLLALERLYLPKLKTINVGTSHIAKCFIGEQCAKLTKLEMPSLEELRTPLYGASTLVGLEELRMPKLRSMVALSATYQATIDGLPNLILLEVGEMQSSMDVRYWQPSADILANPEFLSNFKTYIAERLQGGYAVGTGPTLTLSKEVRDAIQKDPEIVSIITSKGWTISPAPSV